MWWAWLVCQLIRGRFDLVHAMDIDTLIPAALGRIVLDYKLIYDCRDGLGLVLANIHFPVPQTFTALERVFAPMADGLMFPHGDVRVCAAYFGRRTTRRLPIAQILNVPMVEPPSTYRKPTAQPLRINVSGYLSPVRGAFILAEAFGDSPDVVLDIVGEMRYESIQERFAAFSNITLYGRVPYQQALELMDQADLIWLHYDNSLTNVATGSSNKMFESMMLGKPYLASDESWRAKVARRFELGWSLPYGDIEGLRRLVARLNADPSLLVAAGHRGRKCFEKFFTWPQQRARLLCLYRKVLEGGGEADERQFEGWARFIGEPLDLSPGTI